MPTIRPFTVALAKLAIVAACSSARSELDAKQRYEALEAEMFAAQKLGPEHTVIAVDRAYARLFPAEVRNAVVAKADPASLRALFEAADLAAAHSLEPEQVTHLLHAFEALARAGMASAEHAARVRELMLKVRMFERPDLLSSDHTLRLPQLRDESRGVTPTELVVDDAPEVLIRRSIAMTGPHVIVVSHPKCGFSSRAMTEIARDESLAPSFQRYARWLVPQEASPDLELLRRPHAFRYTIAYRKSEFPMLDTWGTPTFYFMQGNEVVTKVVGWPREGRRQELIDGLRALGLFSD